LDKRTYTVAVELIHQYRAEGQGVRARGVAALPVRVGGVPVTGEVAALALPPAPVPVMGQAGPPGHLALAGNADAGRNVIVAVLRVYRSHCQGSARQCRQGPGGQFKVLVHQVSLLVVCGVGALACQPPPSARYRATSLVSCCNW